MHSIFDRHIPCNVSMRSDQQSVRRLDEHVHLRTLGSLRLSQTVDVILSWVGLWLGMDEGHLQHMTTHMPAHIKVRLFRLLRLPMELLSQSYT